MATSHKACVTRVPVTGAQSCTAGDNRQDYEVRADDGVYDSGSEYQNTQLVVTLAEATLADIAALAGADYDETSKELTEAELDAAPEVALNFSGLRADGGKRLLIYILPVMWQVYSLSTRLSD